MRNFDLWKTERDEAENIDGLLLVLRGSTSKGKPTAIMWKPRAKKPFSINLYTSVEARERDINSALESAQHHKEMTAKRKADRKGTEKDLAKVQVGSIFHWSWGYEQTNCQFFQVVEKKGKKIVLREIGQKSVPGSESFMSDSRLPIKGQFLKKDPFSKKLQFSNGKPYISMKFGWCDLWDGKPQHCSWYH